MKYRYYFWLFGKETPFAGTSMQDAINQVTWSHCLGNSKGKVFFESSNDPNAPMDKGVLNYVGGFFNLRIKFTPIPS